MHPYAHHIYRSTCNWSITLIIAEHIWMTYICDMGEISLLIRGLIMDRGHDGEVEIDS